MRLVGEKRALRSQWRLLACASILRVAVTRVLPLAGAAGWWVTLACLLPGYALYALACWGLKRSGSTRLSGKPVVCLLAAAALLADAVSSMTALTTLFVEGVGTAGTQLTLAVVAAGMLLFSLRREGLARGIYFLRWLLLVLAALVAAGYLLMARADHLSPLLGGGEASLWAAFRAGAGAGWVFLLPLMEEAPGKRRLAEPLPPMLACTGALLCLNLCVPHEQIVVHQALGDSLMVTVEHLGPLLRLVCICLWMGAIFLAMGSACSLSAGYILAPTGRELAWLPGALAVLLAATQAFSARKVWQGLGVVEPWLGLALAVGAILSFRRKKQ